MNLTSVKYQDSCIYIGLKGFQEGKRDEKYFENLKSVYAVYKIKAYDNYVRDSILVKKRDITFLRGEMTVKFELNQLHKPEECQIEIVSLKFVFKSGKREELKINESYEFLEIKKSPPIASSKKRTQRKGKNPPKKNDLSVKQEVVRIAPKPDEEVGKSGENLSSGKREQVKPLKPTIIVKEKNPSSIVSEIETKIESKLDAQTKKLELDIKQLCYETIDLILTSLPQPELAEDYRASNAMVKSIHRYINNDLLQKDQEEVGSA